MTTTEQLIKTVKEMRHAQKKYFAAKFQTAEKTQWLNISKEKEKAVDLIIKEFEDNQVKLF